MLAKKNERYSDPLLIFGLFLFSNVTAFVYVRWLVPEIVFGNSVAWLILAILCIWLMNKQAILSKFIENLKRNWIILPFLIFSGFSIFWSVYWEISLYRWLVLVCTIFTGGYVGLRYDLKKIIEFLSVFSIYILLFSSILIFFAPQVGVMNYYIIQGAWKGLYWHKNHMGLIATFANTLFLINVINSLQSKERRALFWGLLYCYSLLVVYQSDSVAAYIVVLGLHGLISVALLLLKFGKKLRRTHYLLFVLVLMVASLIFYVNADLFFGIFNRNTTLTGRVPMWTYLFDAYISKRPFLGYGFNAFWYLGAHRVAVQSVAGYPDPVIISDNGFIDILVNTGWVGLILFAIFYLGAWWRSIKGASRAIDITGIFPLILMANTLLANVSWSLLFENESFFMLIMISVLFCASARESAKGLLKNVAEDGDSNLSTNQF